MKTILKTSILTILTLAAVAQTASAAPVVANSDSFSTEGLAFSDANQNAFTDGFYELGWLNPGTTEAQVACWFASGDFASLDAAFNQVVGFAFSDTLNNAGAPGFIFNSTEIVDSNNAAAFAAYKNAATGAAGKRAYAWIRDSVSVGGTQHMAFVEGSASMNFAPANDTIGFTDFQLQFATDGNLGVDVWVGSIQAVQVGGGIDMFDGSADGVNAAGDINTLELAAVPEPATALFGLVGLVGVALRRTRRA